MTTTNENDGWLPIEDLSEIGAGSMLGEFSIAGVLAEGSMATVYSAVHPVIGRRAAIKVMSERLSHDATAVEAFRREARDIAQIRHPNIVDVFAFGSLPDQRSYFVMEWLDGESLGSRLRRGRLTLGECCDILIQVCDALEAAHSQHIVHLDLKPENVYLVPLRAGRAHVKLLDFGIARHFRDGARPELDAQFETVSGTPAYVSPEQAQGKEVDQRSDLYSLGVMAFEMILGKIPFTADSIRGMFSLHIKEPPPRPRSLWPEIPPSLEQLLLGLLEKQPKHRPPLSSARSCLAGLRDSSLQIKTGPVAVTGTTPLRRSNARRRFMLLALAAGMVFLAGAGWSRFACQGDRRDAGPIPERTNPNDSYPRH